jgi:hypothetical protein
MNKSNKNLLIFSMVFLISLLLYFYTNKSSEYPKVSYYFWKSYYQVSEKQLKLANPHALYIKFLDMGYSNKLELVTTRFKQIPTRSLIPVVYIDNRVLKHEGIASLINAIKRLISTQHYQHIQIDCDWTLSTRKKYFALLNTLRNSYPHLEATIRLHQIKYFYKTGVPPVDTGILMYYNMSDIRNLSTKNAILDQAVAKKYHVNFQRYPLPLKLALPIYQQIRVIRQNKVVMILTAKTLNQEKIEQVSVHHYRVNHAHYVQGRYLYKGDDLYMDTVDESALTSAAYALKPLLQIKELIFYEFSYAKDFGYERIENIRRIFN